MTTPDLKPWKRVLAATEGHNIDTIGTTFDQGGRAWTYIRCTCGLGREAFTDSWEFTDHIRRIVFDALSEADPT